MDEEHSTMDSHAPPLIVEDGEVGVDEEHSTMDSHVPPPPPPPIVEDGEVGVDEEHAAIYSTMRPSSLMETTGILVEAHLTMQELSQNKNTIEQQHSTRSSMNSKSLLPGTKSSKALCMYP